jgi:hypothetical protein
LIHDVLLVDKYNQIAKINRQSRDTTVQRSGRATYDAAALVIGKGSSNNDEGCSNNIHEDNNGRFDGSFEC